MREVDATAWLAAWFESSRDDLESTGLSIKFGQSPKYPLKHSAWISADRVGRLANLQVWSSGEAELDLGAYDLIEVQTHYDLRNEADLAAAIGDFLRYLSDS